jgi:hypothetical protein
MQLTHEQRRIADQGAHYLLSLIDNPRPNRAHLTILIYLWDRRGHWFTTARLARAFCDVDGPHFIGMNFARRLRELAERGCIERVIGKSNDQTQWRMP